MEEIGEATGIQAIVIGSGFAGAVTACRMTEAGLRVLVLERGHRYQEEDFPVFPQADIPCVESDRGASEPATPDAGRLLWAMNHGMWDLRDLGEIVVAQAAGYGGGSLFYANVHLRPPAEVFEKGWPDLEAYKKEALDKYFDLAAYMLDVKPYPKKAPKLAKTRQMERAAEKLGRKDQWFFPPLAVNFHPSEWGEQLNRFGRKQRRCKLRGDCCFGCVHMAKNTLDLNYLALAERPGEGGTPAEIRTLAEVLCIRQRKDERVYEVEYRDLETGDIVKETAPHVFLCAGAVNSTELLLKSREAEKLPCPGPEKGLGAGFYPNADSIAVAFDCEELQEMDRGPTITSALLYQDDGHWFLFEDGGMPTDLEPFLGVFRSPLWLGRNRFWEGGAPPPSARAPRVGYATLPFQSVGDAIPGLSPGSSHWRSPLLREVAGALAEIDRGLRSPESLGRAEGSESAQAVGRMRQSQLVKALEVSRDRFLDAVVFGAEPFLARLLEQASKIVGERFKVEDLLKRIPLPTDRDVSGIDEKAKLPERLLRLGAQLGWGSQGGLVREVVTQLLERARPDAPETVEHATDLLRWLLDFRMSDSRTGMILCMGRDSDPPATLSIEIPEPPPIGSIITGEKASDEKGPGEGKEPSEEERPGEEEESSEENAPRATGILLSVGVRKGSWALDDAAGTLMLARLSGTFDKGKRLFVGDRWIGEVEKEVPIFKTIASESAGDDASNKAKPPLELFEIHFKPPSPQAKVKTQTQKAARRNLLAARVRARFPEPPEPTKGKPPQKPDWYMQERMLRDIVNEGWGGELRTDPISAFMRRRLTVHPQGGCPMGRVTKPDGEVIGCPGLYVMDAAAFPKSVGVNPSATILAIAEYKVEQFIQGLPDQSSEWRADHFDAAREWMDEPGKRRREELDPLRYIRCESKLPKSEPVGIKFEEKMEGRCGATKENQNHAITADLDAEIEDLAWFLELHERGQNPDIAVKGTVKLTPPEPPEVELKVRCGGQSYIRLFRKVESPAAGGETRLIEYRLDLVAKDGTSYLIEGEKTIEDQVGTFDLWADVRKLEFRMEKNGTRFAEGVLEVPAAEFFGDQLASFKATITKDPVRQLWALTAFGKLFFGHLLDVYLPELKALGEAAKCIAERTHV